MGAAVTDLHGWITQQIDKTEHLARACTATDWRHIGDGVIVDRDTDGWQHGPDNAVIARVDVDRIYYSCSPPHAPDADHIATHSPDNVLRRCAADRKILARHRLATEWAAWARDEPCHGCGVMGDCDDPVTDHLNDCPELLDLGHAHGLTDEILATLDKPEMPPRPAPKPLGGVLSPDIGATADVPPTLRGPNWKGTTA